jgi:hypothetical protein
VNPPVFGLFSKNRDEESLEPRECVVEFILVMVEGGTPEMISERMGIVCDVASSKEAMVQSAFGPCALIVMSEDIELLSGAAGCRILIVEELQNRLGNAGKIVHGVSRGFAGLVGFKPMFSYGAVFPEWDAVLAMAGKLPSGTAFEFRAAEGLTNP